MSIIMPGGCMRTMKAGKRRGMRCGRKVVFTIKREGICEYHFHEDGRQIDKRNEKYRQQQREDVDNLRLGRWIRANRPGQFKMFLDNIKDYELKH